jgi:hypothetical protein
MARIRAAHPAMGIDYSDAHQRRQKVWEGLDDTGQGEAAGEADQRSEGVKSLEKAAEFAEYMAKSAEHLLDAINAADSARIAEEDGEAVSPGDIENADMRKSEAMSGLRSDIYEFRKRVP